MAINFKIEDPFIQRYKLKRLFFSLQYFNRLNHRSASLTFYPYFINFMMSFGPKEAVAIHNNSFSMEGCLPTS